MYSGQFQQEKQVLSASSCFCGRALYHRVHNYASPPDGGKPTKCSDISSENSASAWILVAYWPIPNRALSLTSHVILLMVVSSLLTEARSYEFSRHLEYYLWYTLANSPIGFWNRLNSTFTMAEHFFWHPTSTIVTTTPPNTEIWSMSHHQSRHATHQAGFVLLILMVAGKCRVCRSKLLWSIRA